MPIQIQGPGPTDALRRQFGFVGRLVPRLDETVSPVAVISDTSLEMPPGAVRRAVADVVASGVAGERVGFRFEMPPNSLAVVTALSLSLANSGSVQIAFGSQLTGPFTLGAVSFVDGRLRGSNVFPAPTVPAGRLSRCSQVAAIIPVFRMTGGASLGQYVRHTGLNWPIGGLNSSFDFLEVQLNAVADAGRMNIEWVEFPWVQSTL